ncbi:glycoside hydrolase family 18 protein [Algoriphagus sp. AK58]|uniref:glycoside hydrolase family 18 protein n=1 Tax=Algoriphagus sp. AK58 TaxID=1406877 RepID=UPI001650133A|nr:glycoside hydrolase family 18 protein [Algoriphagus sp. AK58]MBC6365822.1 glycoside hydrolase [Algoriphagus sp. AK58]
MNQSLFRNVVFSLTLVITFPFSSLAQKPYIVGYVASWKGVDPDQIPAEKLTHLNYAFANVEDGIVTSGKGLAERDSLNFILLQQLKQRNPDLKILVSIGGWTWSKGFSDAVLTAEGLTKLTKSGIDFLIKHRLDGLDFDWEYPAWPGDNNPVRPEDRENFVAMLKSFREALDSLGSLHGKHYLSTIASGGFRQYLEVNDLRSAQHYLDFINIMAYDFFGAGDPFTGHHANLFDGEPELVPEMKKGRSAHSAVLDHIEFGVPAEKLVVGVPFYGKRWKNVEAGQTLGRYQPAEFDQSMPYARIKELLLDPSYEKYWDSTSQTPFLYSPANKHWVTYEDERSMAIKMKYIKEKGLAGAMFWELSEDPDGTLLETMDKELNN